MRKLGGETENTITATGLVFEILLQKFINDLIFWVVGDKVFQLSLIK